MATRIFAAVDPIQAAFRKEIERYFDEPSSHYHGIDEIETPSTVEAMACKTLSGNPISENPNSETSGLHFGDGSGAAALDMPTTTLIKPACLHFQPSLWRGEMLVCLISMLRVVSMRRILQIHHRFEATCFNT